MASLSASTSASLRLPSGGSSAAVVLVLLGGLFFFNRMETSVADRV